jgi:hypothetical protein
MLSPSESATAVAGSASSAADSAAKSVFDLTVWSAIPSILWALIALGMLACFRSHIVNLLAALVVRIKDGAALKVGGLEIGSTSGLVATPGNFSTEDSRVGVYQDDKSRENQRHDIYKEARGAMLVHRLQKSSQDGQLYDILIYVIPHKASFAGLVTVEYFFGSFWGNKIYPSHDRSRGFPIVTSAYGSFLCTAKLIFNDGTSTIVYRYIDFEMGNAVQRPPSAG